MTSMTAPRRWDTGASSRARGDKPSGLTDAAIRNGWEELHGDKELSEGKGEDNGGDKDDDSSVEITNVILKRPTALKMLSMPNLPTGAAEIL